MRRPPELSREAQAAQTVGQPHRRAFTFGFRLRPFGGGAAATPGSGRSSGCGGPAPAAVSSDGILQGPSAALDPVQTAAINPGTGTTAGHETPPSVGASSGECLPVGPCAGTLQQPATSEVEPAQPADGNNAATLSATATAQDPPHEHEVETSAPNQVPDGPLSGHVNTENSSEAAHLLETVRVNPAEGQQAQCSAAPDCSSSAAGRATEITSREHEQEAQSTAGVSPGDMSVGDKIQLEDACGFDNDNTQLLSAYIQPLDASQDDKLMLNFATANPELVTGSLEGARRPGALTNIGRATAQVAGE